MAICAGMRKFSHRRREGTPRVEHDLFRKPVSIPHQVRNRLFRGHALARLALKFSGHSGLLRLRPANEPLQFSRKRRARYTRSFQAFRFAPRPRRSLSHRGERRHSRCLRPYQRAPPGKSEPLFPVALARTQSGASGRHPRIRPRFQPDRAADRAALLGAGDPRRDLQGAAGRQRRVPSPCTGDHAVRDLRRAAGAGVPPRRRDGAERAGLGQPRRVRRHEPAGVEARGGGLACSCAWQALGGGDAPPWRDGGRRRIARARVPHSVFGEERRASTGGACAGSCLAAHAGRSRDGGSAQSRAGAARACLRILGAATCRAGRAREIGYIGACGRGRGAQAASGRSRGSKGKQGEGKSKTESEGEEAMIPFRIAALALFALGLSPAAAQDSLKIAIGQINNWENQPPTLGEEAGIFKKHNLKIEAFGTQGAGETIQAVVSGSADLGAGVGVAGVMRAFSRGAPVRVLLPGFTGTGDPYWYVKADSPIKSLKDTTPSQTIAYSTSGSSSHNIVVAFGQELGAKAKATATGGPPATFTQVMTGQIDVGWSAPPFGIKEIKEGRIRIIARGSDIPSLKGQTVRAIILNANALKEKREAIMRFAKGYREAVDWMYAVGAAAADVGHRLVDVGIG